MHKIKSQLLLFSLTVFMFSCETDDTLPKTFEYSNKIIGEWQQIRTFNLQDASTTPATYDWDEVEDGFTLQLFEDGNFIYTKFDECTTGTYIFNSSKAIIEFNFDCEIDFYGEPVTNLSESFAKDPSQNKQLFLKHQFGPDACEEQCFSILKRIE